MRDKGEHTQYRLQRSHSHRQRKRMPQQKMPEASIQSSTLYGSLRIKVTASMIKRIWPSDGTYTISWGNVLAGDSGVRTRRIENTMRSERFAELCMALMGPLLIPTSPSEGKKSRPWESTGSSRETLDGPGFI